MSNKEKRKFIRFDSLHLLDFIVLDNQGNTGVYSMGRTIDVSVDGLKLETTFELTPHTRLLITVGLEEDLIDLEGEVTHCAPFSGRFVSGVSFVKITKEGRRVLATYVDAFKKRTRV